MLTACGDDEGGGGSEDGGVTPADLDQVESDIADLQSELGGLGDDVTGLGEQLDGLDGDLSSLTEEVTDRLEALENPDLLSCSVEEVCIPDGIELTTTGVADIIAIVCEHEVDCCTDAELNLKFGPGITTAAECVSLFTDVVNNGLSPDFLQESPYIINQIISIAQALNDPRVRVELNPDGIEECVESLQERECPEYLEIEPGDPECYVYEMPEADVCALSNLLNGLQEEGELCGEYGGGYYIDSIPECMAGLYCSWDGNVEGNQGLCAKLPEEGDGCQSDQDCDPVTGEGGYFGSTLLYCNMEEAQCEPMGDVGDSCAFINEDFSIPNGSLYPTYRSATSQDCLPYLTCNPLDNTCVAGCSEGVFCSPGSDPFFTCGDDSVCNVSELPDLLMSFSLGVCTPAIAEGDTCNPSYDECASGACNEDCDPETGQCTCGEELKQPGEDCDVPGPDPLCITALCATDSTCAGFCDCDDDVPGFECDWVTDEFGRDAEQCPDDFYCDFSGSGTSHPDFGNGYGCQPLIDNGTACDISGADIHIGCTSGFCDPDPADDMTGPTFVCSAKQVDTTDGACTSTYDEECPANQYCNAMNICRPYLALNANCDRTDVSGLECADGLYCVDGATDTCQTLAVSGEACSFDGVNEPLCNSDMNLSCIDIDGTGTGVVYECYDYDGGLADGVECQNVDTRCASGWCLPNGPLSPTAYSCAQPLEEGDDCDTLDITLDKCAPGLFCNHPNGDSAGKCAAQSPPGESCKPYFSGLDCINGNTYSCVFTKDQFLCNQSAQPPESLFCDGN